MTLARCGTAAGPSTTASRPRCATSRARPGAQTSGTRSWNAPMRTTRRPRRRCAGPTRRGRQRPGSSWSKRAWSRSPRASPATFCRRRRSSALSSEWLRTCRRPRSRRRCSAISSSRSRPRAPPRRRSRSGSRPTASATSRRPRSMRHTRAITGTWWFARPGPGGCAGFWARLTSTRVGASTPSA